MTSLERAFGPYIIVRFIIFVQYTFLYARYCMYKNTKYSTASLVNFGFRRSRSILAEDFWKIKINKYPLSTVQLRTVQSSCIEHATM